MITGAIKSQIDQIWNAFWSGGISNPLEVIEQITYLLFLRRLDDLHTLEENRSARLKEPMARRIFPTGKDGIGKNGGRSYEDLRWSRFKNFAPSEMYAVVGEHVFPFLRTLGGDDSVTVNVNAASGSDVIPIPIPHSIIGFTPALTVNAAGNIPARLGNPADSAPVNALPLMLVLELIGWDDCSVVTWLNCQLLST
jgi:hypothetical protein